LFQTPLQQGKKQMNNIQKLQKAFAEGLAIEANGITEELSYQSIPEWDSMSHMFLVAKLEEEFGIQIKTEDILEMASYKKVQQILAGYGISFN
jgi:acyl carrier protein